MAKKAHNRYEKKVEQKPALSQNKILVIGAPVVAVIVIVGVLFGLGIVHLPSVGSPSTSFSAPNQIPYGPPFTEVSATDYSPAHTYSIYFISWIGCPIGASLSWGIYGSINAYYSSVQNDVYGHYSSPDEGSLANIPGLIFTTGFSFSAKGYNYTFSPFYMYNETMTGTYPSNTPIPSSQLVSTGESEINASGLPSAITSLAYKYTAVVLTNQGKPSAYLGNPAHVNTVLIITGPSGTWMLNGPYFDPTYLLSNTYTYQYLQSNYNGVQPIVDEMSAINSQLNL
jgi:hypothetical protein